MQDYFARAKQWFPQGDAEDGIVTYGYQVAQALEYVLRACGDDLTRENVMRVADHVALPMRYPGITAITSPTNYFPLEQFQMLRFDDEDWLPFGPLRASETLRPDPHGPARAFRTVEPLSPAREAERAGG